MTWDNWGRNPNPPKKGKNDSGFALSEHTGDERMFLKLYFFPEKGRKIVRGRR